MNHLISLTQLDGSRYLLDPEYIADIRELKNYASPVTEPQPPSRWTRITTKNGVIELVRETIEEILEKAKEINNEHQHLQSISMPLE